MQAAKFDRVIKMRNSGVELLKIIAIILIVIYHVVQTLCLENLYIPYQDYIIDLSIATTSVRDFTLTLFYYFGELGNNIFFICSAWFLLHSSKYNKQKWFYILAEAWSVSIIILGITFIIVHDSISGEMIIRSILPTTLGNNWYITCYLLFYPIHPFLNAAIEKMNRQQLFRVSATMFAIYYGFDFIRGEDMFFSTHIILWIAIYFVMAYMQMYMTAFSNNFKQNSVLLLVGLMGYFGVAFAANISGLYIPYLSNSVLHWASRYNPFLFIISIALFNCMRRLDFSNKIINYISSLSILIYIIPENIILRTYFRPAMWHFIYQNYGYRYLMLWVFVMTAAVFLFALCCSMLYDKTIRRIVHSISNSVYVLGRKCYLKFETIMLKFH